MFCFVCVLSIAYVARLLTDLRASHLQAMHMIAVDNVIAMSLRPALTAALSGQSEFVVACKG